MDGILLVDKPKGWTSHDVVAKIRGVIKKHPSASVGKKIKVGHSGTLDPLATGLMILLVGDYTKKADEFSKLDKTYEVTMKLGETSTTGDAEGKKTLGSKKRSPENEVKDVMDSFIGKSEQIPPVYSAIKIGGKRAYKLARAGKEVKLEPRLVTIYDIQITDYKYPHIEFSVKVSSGTYIRSLVEDIGKKLGTGAYTSDLRRTKVGTYNITDSVSVEDITTSNIIERLKNL